MTVFRIFLAHLVGLGGRYTNGRETRMPNDNIRPEYRIPLVATRRSHHLTEAEVVEGLAGVQPVGEPIPRDEERFSRLSNTEAVTAMKPGVKLPTAEEMVEETINRLVAMYRRGIDGN